MPYPNLNQPVFISFAKHEAVAPLSVAAFRALKKGSLLHAP
jgi:hypothetical protein